MVVILDELTPLEFFNHGGIVKITVNNMLMEECNLKKKYTFFDYKEYVRFFRNLYLVYNQKHRDMNGYDIYKYVNIHLKLKPSIGNAEYVIDLNYDRVMSYEFAKFYFYQEKEPVEVSGRDPYGIPNVCFSQIDDTDDRWEEYTKQRLERGFDNSELWNLEGTIAKFVYPRLEAFYEDAKKGNYRPGDMNREEWLQILEKMVNGFYLMSLDRKKTEDEEAITQEALELFSRYFFTLWN